MREAILREILLVKAVEEADPDGRSLPLDDRSAATREALRECAPAGAAPAPASLERFLAARTRRLFPPLAERHRALAAVASGLEMPSWLTLAVLALAVASGFGLSALDGSRRVDILAVPFVGLVLWNLAVYALAAASRLRRRPESDGHGGAAPGSWLRLRIAPRLGRLLVALPRDAGPLPAGTMARFARDFGLLAADRLAAQGRRLLHLGAAAVAAGLIAGIYLRGTVLRYLAGWESTFLDASQVLQVIDVLYAPAAAISGLPLPRDAAAVEALAWTGGGVPAAPWLHLIALTLLIAVVLPRIALAGGAQLRALRIARSTGLPEWLAQYARSLAGEGAAVAARAASPERTIDLHLISHTNVGKTTLARTLLHRDVGEVRDAEHVTQEASAYEMLATAEGDLLQLWDTPGFGDSARLADRLGQGGAIGWFLSRVWDRIADRDFYLSQLAIASVRERADLVLYLVDARAEPAQAGSLDPEMRILGWLGRPVIVLLNQLGEPRPADLERAEVERWREHLRRYPWVRDALAFDAFARCWVQEGVLADRIGSALPDALQGPWSRLAAAWRQRNEAVFSRSVDALAGHLAAVASDSEPVATRGLVGAAIDWLGRLGRGDERRRAIDDAARALAQRAGASLKRTTAELLALHGLGGELAQQIDARVSARVTIEGAAKVGKAGLLGAALSGAAGGLAADLAAGGLTLGAGALIGALLGAAGGSGLAYAVSLKSGADRSVVRWSPELLADLTVDAALRYLAVAHYGRSRGDYVESEHPPHWEGVVRAAIARSRADWDAAWAAGAESPDGAEAALRARLRPLCERLLRDAFRELYPQAPREGVSPPPSPDPPRS